MESYLSYEKHLIGTLMDTPLSDYSELMAKTVDHNRFKREYPNIAFIGIIGFDENKGRFVVLKIEHNEKTHNSDKIVSEREVEVLKWVAYGLTNVQIARRLFISENTVKVHLKNIFTKLNVQSRVQASMYAVQQGWLPGS
jgi:DNA-binding CsgD family transcriptional regulator